ncbi:NAD-dependent epimerase/dehydratase family protein [Jidongwangia harbinensis]|uniref:NAD-dependent epimerase/dehydratase family protein n=1 Tax=Jidongwangia harbinensis TaxID=2878561 RepID=UPI001CD945F7|nr:NAD-dependent epimerase/dehydratase family protein [Jidongwangia harbinensis]MCA2217960.1 NAD-dependent epimerase/dehydratase family protein [Jidongwangia harbinensis]
MRLLVLGGTQFLGRYLVEQALSAGHHVTLFNRGRTAPDLFPEAHRLVGDRDGDLTALATGSWDAVFDFSGFVPAQVTATAELLTGRVRHYVFMSSIAVYPRAARAGRTEDAETRPLVSGPDTAVTADTYGPLKAACERAAEAACPGRTTAIRAGLVIGPGDRFGAFTSWALAMSGTAPVPCAARPAQPLQTTDVRDLAAFLLRAGTLPAPGVFNVMAPPTTFADLLATCREAGGGSATVRWTDDENIDEYGAFIVQPRDGSEDGAFLLSAERAVAAGYRARPLLETARDTIDWARRTRPQFIHPH